MKLTAVHQLQKNMERSLFCCGLDPDLTKIPPVPGNTNEQKVEYFLKKVIDVTHTQVCAYKIQKAFFDCLTSGYTVLQTIISYVHSTSPGIPVIVDGKVGDIDNTMHVYLETLFGELNADGIVVNPYMGDDVIEPMVTYADRAIVVLAKTSNPGGSIIQDVQVENNNPLWMYILNLIVTRWNTAGNMVPVVSATAHLDMKQVRTMIPDTMPILLAGVGAQGGSYEDIKLLLNSHQSGVFVNSSRTILYPPHTDNQPWYAHIKQAAKQFKEKLNKERA